jgi:hypothetical protein
MNCREFEESVHLLAGETAPPAVEAAARAHAATCPRCLRLLQIVRPEDAATEGTRTGDMKSGDMKPGGMKSGGIKPGSMKPADMKPEVEPDPAEDLTAAILQRTSGAACSRIGERLCEWVDQSLDAIDGELVAQHLRHCSNCAATAEALQLMQAELPQMANLEPDPGFVADVLARTSGCKGERSALAAWRGRWWRARTHAGLQWERLMRRPRIALELAYCGAMIFLIVLGPPVRPSGTAAVASGRMAPLTAAMDFWQQEQPVSKLVIGIRDALAVDVAGPVVRRAEALSPRLAPAGRRLQRTLILAQTCGRDLGRALLRADLSAAGRALSAFRDQVRKPGPDDPVRPAAHEGSTEPCP